MVREWQNQQACKEKIMLATKHNVFKNACNMSPESIQAMGGNFPVPADFADKGTEADTAVPFLKIFPA